MSSIRNECPVCHTAVTNWSSRCPKCRYHPDCDRGEYQRAQDDVAMIARYRPAVAAEKSRPAWRSALPAWLRRAGVA